MAEQSVPDSVRIGVPFDPLAEAYRDPTVTAAFEESRIRAMAEFYDVPTEKAQAIWFNGKRAGVAAGRAQAAADIRAYADKIQRESWTPSTGVALAAVADQCAKIAEEAP